MTGDRSAGGGRNGVDSATGDDPETTDEDAYRTIADPGEAAFTVDGSEFVGLVAPAASVERAEAVVQQRREAYPDATHTVPAYRVRTDPLREYASDDGEPSGSAGKPALSVLQGEGVENVVAVVTRYYGGTNLGVGGLVRAYAGAVKRALAATRIVTERPHERLSVTVAYDDSGTVRGILESTGVEFEGEYREEVTFAVRVPVTATGGLRERIASATSGRATIEAVDDG